MNFINVHSNANKENINNSLLNHSSSIEKEDGLSTECKNPLGLSLKFDFPFAPSQKKHRYTTKNKLLTKSILSRFHEEQQVNVLGQTVAMTARDLKTFIRSIDRVANNQTAQITSKSISGETLHWITYVNKKLKRQAVLWNGHATPNIEMPEFINQGANGVVQSVWNVATGELLALKSIKKRLPNESCPIAFEGRTITKINLACTQNESYFQEAPEVILDVSSGVRGCDNKSLTGYISKKYDGDVAQLASAHDLPRGVPLLQNMRRVSVAVLNLRQQGLSHGDLKAANILYRKNDDGTYAFFVADMGDCKSDQHWFNTKKGSAFTGLYTASSDYYTRQDAYKTQSGLSLFVEKRDVFAMGVTFAQWLTGKKPLEKTSVFHNGVNVQCLDSFKGVSQDHLNEITEKYGQRMSTLIKNMLQDNCLERPSALEVTQELDKILASPETYMLERWQSDESEDGATTIQVDYEL